jgi:hypothetical protein
MYDSNEYSTEVESILINNGIPLPDHAFDADIEDKMSEISECRPGQYISGCYLFLDDGFTDTNVSFLYAGKAARLKNRIRTHIRHAKWFDEYWHTVFDADPQTMNGAPVVYVWLTDDRAVFEAKLIRSLRPIYNRRYEG